MTLDDLAAKWSRIHSRMGDSVSHLVFGAPTGSRWFVGVAAVCAGLAVGYSLGRRMRPERAGVESRADTGAVTAAPESGGAGARKGGCRVVTGILEPMVRCGLRVGLDAMASAARRRADELASDGRRV